MGEWFTCLCPDIRAHFHNSVLVLFWEKTTTFYAVPVPPTRETRYSSRKCSFFQMYIWLNFIVLCYQKLRGYHFLVWKQERGVGPLAKFTWTLFGKINPWVTSWENLFLPYAMYRLSKYPISPNKFLLISHIPTFFFSIPQINLQYSISQNF